MSFTWKQARECGYKIVRTSCAHGYIPVTADPDQAPVKRGRYGLYFEEHHPVKRNKKLRNYIA